jgi:hypothetical protein
MRRYHIEDLSGFTNIALATGLLSGPEDFRNTVNTGPPEHTFDGPLLAEAPYPDIIVAKAWSHGGTDLNLILYPGQDGAIPRVKLSLERLKKGGRYSISQGDSTQNFVAEWQGSAIVDVLVRGRTPVMIQSVF